MPSILNSIFGVSTSLAAPSATVGQLNTPDMRSSGADTSPEISVNAVLTSNTKRPCQGSASNGEYREHGRTSFLLTMLLRRLSHSRKSFFELAQDVSLYLSVAHRPLLLSPVCHVRPRVGTTFAR